MSGFIFLPDNGSTEQGAQPVNLWTLTVKPAFRQVVKRPRNKIFYFFPQFVRI
jgi:hypothetical protein